MVLGCFFVDDKCICSYNILLERYTDIPQESVKKIYFERNAGRCLGERMYKRVVAVLAAISVAFFSSTTVIADEVSDYGTDADIVLVEETEIPDADIEATEEAVIADDVVVEDVSASDEDSEQMIDSEVTEDVMAEDDTTESVEEISYDIDDDIQTAGEYHMKADDFRREY